MNPPTCIVCGGWILTRHVRRDLAGGAVCDYCSNPGKDDLAKPRAWVRSYLEKNARGEANAVKIKDLIALMAKDKIEANPRDLREIREQLVKRFGVLVGTGPRGLFIITTEAELAKCRAYLAKKALPMLKERGLLRRIFLLKQAHPLKDASSGPSSFGSAALGYGRELPADAPFRRHHNEAAS